MSKFYVTTPIYYVNGAPHIGHAYTTVVADALARHYRQRGWPVYFITGTDEHGLKVQRAAEAAGLAPKAMADRNSEQFRQLFERLGLSHDRFIRTTDQDHEDTVIEMIRRMKASGDIYLDQYEGWYAAADEAFVDESEIEDGRSIASGASVEWLRESSYFFRLSAFADRLLAWYAQDPSPVLPETRRNEVASFVAGGLRDLSVSRTTFDWGIAWPEDPEHVVYVWVDALTNYVTGAGGFSDPERFAELWPASLHLLGKDILRFHAVYWPAFLMSAGLPLPEQVLAHGWWVGDDGEKQSKSKGNVVDVLPLLDRYSLDSLRYFLLREKSLGTDGTFSERRLIERNNSELADNLGNLVNRALSMAERYYEGQIPDGRASELPVDAALRERCSAARAAIERAMDAREPNLALEALFELSSAFNLYVNDMRPWDLAKLPDRSRLDVVIYHALEGIRQVAVLAAAFLPDASRAILAGLGQTGEDAAALSGLEWGGLVPGTKVSAPEILFLKLDADEILGAPDDAVSSAPAESSASGADLAAPKVSTHKAAPMSEGLIQIDQFGQVQLRAGQILEAGRVAKADRLLLLRVDLGEPEGPRLIVAGIAASYEPEVLIGLRVAVVANLEPATIRGQLSQGMLLAAEREDGGLELVQLSEAVPLGSRIR